LGYLLEKHLTLANKLSELNNLASAVESFAEQAGLGMKTQFNLNLVLDELVTNIISYAYTDEHLHQIEITLSYDTNLLSIKLSDDGELFDPTLIKTQALTEDLEQRELGGLGIHFVKKLMDKMEYHRVDKRNHLLLEKELHEEIT
jgi:anti-sigma regulatory factor (Ser/Thr protein kinase)